MTRWRGIRSRREGRPHLFPSNKHILRGETCFFKSKYISPTVFVSKTSHFRFVRTCYTVYTLCIYYVIHSSISFGRLNEIITSLVEKKGRKTLNVDYQQEQPSKLYLKTYILYTSETKKKKNTSALESYACTNNVKFKILYRRYIIYIGSVSKVWEKKFKNKNRRMYNFVYI